ncbi:MAG TPA: SDR family oxidoreductase [Candidatus Dormibacteraeota bacterium]|nr:SDR family oxidoreductase [Candidatus Dormibacteraeota bacterium]
MATSPRAAVVTGASRGIGRAIATRLATAGVAVGLTARDPATLTAVSDEIRLAGGKAVVAAADVSGWEQVQAASRRIESEVGPIDLLVNGAGMAAGGNLWEADLADWWRVIEVNLRGALNWSRALLPGMVERRRGRIVNVAGYVGIRPSGAVTPYAVAKAALIRLTDSLAEQLSATPVKVFAIAPGTVRTEITLSLPAFADFTDWDPPALAADLVVRLASGDADALNGRLLHVRDDLDEMLARAEEINALDLYQLRLYKHPGDRRP